jgi:hypothetical protein
MTYDGKPMRLHVEYTLMRLPALNDCEAVSMAMCRLSPPSLNGSTMESKKESRVFDLDMATCPFCRRGSLRIIAAITQESVITRILRHLKLASVPPPIAPARIRQEIFAFDDAHASVGS